MQKIRPIKIIWCDRLTKQTIAKEKKPKLIRDKLKNRIDNNICGFFETEEEKEERKELKKNKNKNN